MLISNSTGLISYGESARLVRIRPGWADRSKMVEAVAPPCHNYCLYTIEAFNGSTESAAMAICFYVRTRNVPYLDLVDVDKKSVGNLGNVQK